MPESKDNTEMLNGDTAFVETIDLSFEDFCLAYRAQLSSSAVPEHLWGALHRKLVHIPPILDAGSVFALNRVETPEGKLLRWEAVVTSEGGIRAGDAEQIYLIDHAWTFRASEADRDLVRIDGLLGRMAALADLEEEDLEKTSRAKWRLANTYSIRSRDSDASEPFWYVMDEFGSRIGHAWDNQKPNVRVVPFVFTVQEGAPIAYSLLFPIEDIVDGAEICRDFVEGPESLDPLNREALLNVWRHSDMTDHDWRQVEPPIDFFQSARQNETLPAADFEAQPLPTDRVIKVYAEYEAIRSHLRNRRFELTDCEEDADILWYTKHFKDYKTFSERFPLKYVNQFPYECVLTIKDFLCVVGRRKAEKVGEDTTLETSPKWLPTTYNLKTELPEFVCYFQRREKECLDNHWIVKPWNLARGMDMHVSPYLERILRQPFSGPKIAQKYIHDPVLFERPDVGLVKFDIRYILLLHSTQPELKVYAYDRFWLRFANKEFALSDYDAYDRHFTVMNYKEDVPLKQMFCDEYIRLFEQQYPSHPWSEVQASIFSMFRSIFEAAIAKPPPAGIARSPQSRSMFAADLMLEWSENKIQPKLLEINWGPDCERACLFYPEFFDNVFSVLYLDQTDGQNVTRL